MARLRGIQVTLARKPSTYLHSLEGQLIQEYNAVLHQEFLFWRLKSPIMWLNYGDANTKFFHVKTIQRRSHLRVATLKDDTGLWLIGEPLTQHIHKAFQTLFQASSPCHRNTPGLRDTAILTVPFSPKPRLLLASLNRWKFSRPFRSFPL